MYPYLGRYGPFFLTSYNVVLGLGMIGAVALVVHRARRTDGDRAAELDGLLALLLAGLAGGRLGYVIGNWSYFADRPAEALALWQGGLSYHGALLAGGAAWWLWRRRAGRPLTGALDALAPALALGTAAGWAACWLEGCAYGREAALGLWTAELPDAFGVIAVRYRTQLAGFLSSAVALVVALAGRPQRPGRRFAATWFLLSAGHALAALGRGDEAWPVGPWRLDLAAAAAQMAITAVWWLLTWPRGVGRVATDAGRR